MIAAGLNGYFTALSLILAIGAQNSFVLRQGLARSNVFWICLFCAASDAILITAGVVGFGALVDLYPSFPRIMALLGAAFLFVYGAMRLWAAYQGEYHMEIAGKAKGLGTSLATVATLTWLNPHVYLDTVGLIGAVSTQYLGVDKWAFGICAALASFSFFFALGYGARLLAPVMSTARAWRLLDILIALVMFAIAIGLLFH